MTVFSENFTDRDLEIVRLRSRRYFNNIGITAWFHRILQVPRSAWKLTQSISYLLFDLNQLKRQKKFYKLFVFFLTFIPQYLWLLFFHLDFNFKKSIICKREKIIIILPPQTPDRHQQIYLLTLEALDRVIVLPEMVSIW